MNPLFELEENQNNHLLFKKEGKNKISPKNTRSSQNENKVTNQTLSQTSSQTSSHSPQNRPFPHLSLSQPSSTSSRSISPTNSTNLINKNLSDSNYQKTTIPSQKNLSQGIFFF